MGLRYCSQNVHLSIWNFSVSFTLYSDSGSGSSILHFFPPSFLPFPPFSFISFFPSCSPPSSVPQFVFQLFLLLDVPLGAESLHKAPTPRVKEKRAAKREKGREKGKDKIEGERSQRRREQAERRAVKRAENRGQRKSEEKT